MAATRAAVEGSVWRSGPASARASAIDVSESGRPLRPASPDTRAGEEGSWGTSGERGDWKLIIMQPIYQRFISTRTGKYGCTTMDAEGEECAATRPMAVIDKVGRVREAVPEGNYPLI